MAPGGVLGAASKWSVACCSTSLQSPRIRFLRFSPPWTRLQLRVWPGPALAAAPDRGPPHVPRSQGPARLVDCTEAAAGKKS
jgi:hypothetical protein